MSQPPADWNPALVWPQPGDETGPETEEFRVIGTTSVDGHAPGTTFTAIMSDDRKALLLGSHLELVVPDSVEELREEARELDVKGRSKMTKDELKEAVEKARADQLDNAVTDPAEQPNPAAAKE